jgi:hypothetical protein
VDIEWLLSTLFDASLLSTSGRRQRRLFFVSIRDNAPPYGLRSLKLARQLCRNFCPFPVWTGMSGRAMLSLIKARVTAPGQW